MSEYIFLHKFRKCPMKIYKITTFGNVIEFLVYLDGTWQWMDANNFSPDYWEDGTGGYRWR